MGRAGHPPALDRPVDWAGGGHARGVAAEWADYQSLQAAIGTAAIHHDVYLGAQVETDTGRSRRAGRGGSELAQLCEHLLAIGLRPKVLSRRGSRRSCASGPIRRRTSAWPAGVRGRSRHPGRDRRPASSATTRCSTDGYVHRVGQIAAWPRIDVATEWMYPLLAERVPGSVRTVSMHLEAVSTEQAFAEVRDARTTGGMAQRKRDEKGIITTEEEERRVDEARLA